MWLNFEGTVADFRRLGKSEPGVLIEVIIDGKNVPLLIGDMSPFLSIMNGDCLKIDSCKLTRYAFVWRRSVRGKI